MPCFNRSRINFFFWRPLCTEGWIMKTALVLELLGLISDILEPSRGSPHQADDFVSLWTAVPDAVPPWVFASLSNLSPLPRPQPGPWSPLLWSPECPPSLIPPSCTWPQPLKHPAGWDYLLGWSQKNLPSGHPVTCIPASSSLLPESSAWYCHALSHPHRPSSHHLCVLAPSVQLGDISGPLGRSSSLPNQVRPKHRWQFPPQPHHTCFCCSVVLIYSLWFV